MKTGVLCGVLVIWSIGAFGIVSAVGFGWMSLSDVVITTFLGTAGGLLLIARDIISRQ